MRRKFASKLARDGYNKNFLEDVQIDDARNLTILALDADYRWKDYEVLGEYARANLDLPPGLEGSIYAEKQQGIYLQGSVAFLRDAIHTMPGSYLEGVIRYGWVDFDADVVGDHQTRLTLGLNFRPTQDSVFKFNYLYNWMYDRNNVRALSAGLLFSVATYF